MTIKLYDTLSKSKREFLPIEKGRVRLYHCGPTVYWTQHIGNMRGMFCADIMVRSLRYLGYNVKHVRNYTDVGHLSSDGDVGEDKMEKGVRREGISPTEIANKYINIFENDTKDLNILEPNVKPRATEYINEMIKMVEVLLKKDYAYSTDLAIYFDVSKAKDYTKLSGQNLEENLQGAGKSEISDSRKKNPADFVIWFFKAGSHKNALQHWKSPFNSPLVSDGDGFPGWHLECSTMSKKNLGDTIDIHMGGIEHIPVHHTNEIAQSEGVTGKKFANYWIHNEHLLVENKKMAKSEGTSYSLQEIKDKGFNPLSLRYLFLTAHYKSKLNFTWKSLKASEKTLFKLYDFVISSEEDGKIIEKYEIMFKEALENNLDTPKALAIVWAMLKSKDDSKKDKKTTLLKFDKVLGLDLANVKKENIPEEISKLVKLRENFRKKKDWKLSDKLREEIDAKGYEIEDTSKETIIKHK